MALSDRIAVFNRGRIERLDEPAALYDRPGIRFVATFPGASNIFAGRLSGERGRAGRRSRARTPGTGVRARFRDKRSSRTSAAVDPASLEFMFRHDDAPRSAHFDAPAYVYARAGCVDIDGTRVIAVPARVRMR